MVETIATHKFAGPTDATQIMAGTVLETSQGLEKVVFNNYVLLRTLSRQGEEGIIYYQYIARKVGEFNPNTRQAFGGPYSKYSADIIEREIFEILDRELMLGGL